MADKTFLEGTTLLERQMRYYNGHQCIYCNQLCNIVDDKVVYGKSYGGLLYWCKACDAYVGTKIGTDQSSGTVAKKPLRELRQRCFKMISALIEKKSSQGVTKRGANAKFYKWLAAQLEINIVECHIGYFDEERCHAVMALCQPFFNVEKKPDPEPPPPQQQEQSQPEKIEKKDFKDYTLTDNSIDWIKYWKEVIYYLAGQYEFEVYEKTELELHLKLKPNKTLVYFPVTKKAQWLRGGFFEIGDLEKFVNDFFKQKT